MSDTPRDCKHGNLARSCEICTLERELAAATARAESAERDALQRAAAVATNHAGVCISNGYGEKARTASTIADIILALIPKEKA